MWAKESEFVRTSFTRKLVVIMVMGRFSKARFRGSGWSDQTILLAYLLGSNLISEDNFSYKCSLRNDWNTPAPKSKLAECDLITHVDISRKQTFADWSRALSLPFNLTMHKSRPLYLLVNLQNSTVTLRIKKKKCSHWLAISSKGRQFSSINFSFQSNKREKAKNLLPFAVHPSGFSIFQQAVLCLFKIIFF